MQYMDDSHYDEVFNEDIAIYKPDGSPLLVLLKQALDPQLASNAWECLKKVNGKTENRSTAVGISARPRKKLDGTYSKTTRVPAGWEVKSAIIGSFERTVRAPYAHACAWNAANPGLFTRTFPLLRQTSGLFEQHVPDRFAVQKAHCDRTHSDWVIPGTAYTTLTVNKNFRTAAHKDAGDLETGFSNMFIISQGRYQGARLVLPNWRIAVELENLDFVMFDAHEFHGNTQLMKLTPNAVRCSVVCYYRTKMVRCLSAKEEIIQAQNRVAGQPIFQESP